MGTKPGHDNRPAPGIRNSLWSCFQPLVHRPSPLLVLGRWFAPARQQPAAGPHRRRPLRLRHAQTGVQHPMPRHSARASDKVRAAAAHSTHPCPSSRPQEKPQAQGPPPSRPPPQHGNTTTTTSHATTQQKKMIHPCPCPTGVTGHAKPQARQQSTRNKRSNTELQRRMIGIGRPQTSFKQFCGFLRGRRTNKKTKKKLQHARHSNPCGFRFLLGDCEAQKRAQDGRTAPVGPRRADSRATRGAVGEEDAGGGGEAEPVRVRGRRRGAPVVDGAAAAEAAGGRRRGG